MFRIKNEISFLETGPQYIKRLADLRPLQFKQHLADKKFSPLSLGAPSDSGEGGKSIV